MFRVRQGRRNQEVEKRVRVDTVASGAKHWLTISTHGESPLTQQNTLIKPGGISSDNGGVLRCRTWFGDFDVRKLGEGIGTGEFAWLLRVWSE